MSNVWTMVVVNVNAEGNVLYFTLVSNNLENRDVSVKDMPKFLSDNNVANMCIDENGKVKTCNGSMDRYSHFCPYTGEFIGRVRPVILGRIEKDKNLAGYVVFNISGKVNKLSVADAVALHKKTGISNAKIKHTSGGDILSSITGNYQLIEIDSKGSVGTSGRKVCIDVELAYICMASAIGMEEKVMYCGVVVRGNYVDAVSNLMSNVFERDNAKLSAKLVKMAGKEVMKSLKPIRLNATGHFIVVPYETLHIVDNNNGVSVKVNDATKISRMIYKNEKFVEVTGEVVNGKIEMSDKCSESDVNIMQIAVDKFYK